MNKKIYNNLNIENLTKTRWFNQFSEYQQEEIIMGIKTNVDISIYAKTVFDANQMNQIRYGLEDNLEISIYAKPEYSWLEMKHLRLRLLEKSTQ